jgi:hypothetical protein
MQTPANIDPWIQAASANLDISMPDRLKAINLFHEFQRLDWWSDYSDDGDVRYREMIRTGNALDQLKEFAGGGKDHAYLASRIYDKTAPEEFERPRAADGINRNAWYVAVEETPEVAAKVRDRLEVWEAWQQREFSTATIAADPWTAVYLQIPENADARLLAAAQVAAVALGMIELDGHGPRVPQGDGPAENQAKAMRRLDELDGRLAALIANENSPERIAGEKTPEPMTMEAIRADNWAAVDLPIPDNADPILLNNASFAAMACFNERHPPEGVTHEGWEERRSAAGERVKELADRMEPVWDTLGRADKKDLIIVFDHADQVRAWQAPSFDEFTISTDPWTAVYLPIPENAGRDLLEHARGWAADLAEYAARDPVHNGPFVTLPNDAPERLATATARMAELDSRLQIGHSRWTGEPLGDQEAMTIEAIARDPWAAIRKPMPEAPSDELLKVAREAVGHCLDELKPGSDRYEGAMGRLAEIEATMWAGVSQSAGKGQSHR